VVDRDGLFPVTNPSTQVACPSVFFTPQTSEWSIRQVSLLEALRLYSVPTSYDWAFAGSFLGYSHLPFEDSVSPDLLSSVFRQMWGVQEGVCVVGTKSSCLDDPHLETASVDSAIDSGSSSEGLLLNQGNLDILTPTLSLPEYAAVPLTKKFREGDVVLTKRFGILQRGIVLSIQADGYLVVLDLRSTSFDLIEGPNECVLFPGNGDLLPAVVSPLLIPAFPAPSASLDAASAALKYSKAVKADDAEVPVHLWDNKVFTPEVSATCQPVSDECKIAAANTLRDWGLSIYRRNLLADCRKRLQNNYNKEVRVERDDGQGYVLNEDGSFKTKIIPWYDTAKNPRETKGKVTPLAVELHALSNILWHASEATWFEYTSGSQIHYFRFPPFYQLMAKEGVRVYFEKAGPTSKSAQQNIGDEGLRAQVKKKLEKVVNRRYIIEAAITLKSLIKYFSVQKGDDDIRMVYDATANELNDAVWTPSFWLPTVDSMIRALDSNSFMMDCDIGEQFLNYPLHRDVWPYTGLDLGPILSEKDLGEGKARWYHWVRMLMGFKPSPYIAVKMTLIAEEVIRGDRHDEENPFQWTTIRTNLPGSDDYDPRVSWISKIRKDGRVAADLFTFVDDERVTGPDEDVTWKAGHRLGYIQSYLGIQNAVRKLRECTQTAGSWVGSVVHILPEYGVCVLTSPEKWNKLRNILRKWLDRIESGEEELDHKELLSDRGFLVYVTRTYPAMIPYLKGFHLTIENWRDGRDSDGWKLQRSSLGTTKAEDFEDEDLEATLEHKLLGDLGEVTDHHAPPGGTTTAVPRFRDDLLALVSLSNFELPPLRLVRGKVVFSAMYGFGDASGKGFGATVGDGSSVVRYRMGIWGKDAEDESSNYRELRNLVETVEEEARKGNLANTEFFLFTDNSTAESAFYRSNSSSKLLHALILRLRLLEIEQSIIIHVIHVSGKRMIAQGTDGCSRGSRLEGVMAGKNMLSFVPLAETATTRHPPLIDWIRSWTSKALTPLSVEEWFDRGHGIIGGKPDAHGIWMPSHEKRRQMHLWDPPPALADAALEELLKARHKRTDTFHVILIPRLMLPRWRRLFNKVCDFSFSVPANHPFWPESMFEPLWIGIVLPFTTHRPWQLGRAPLLVEMARDLHEVFTEGRGDGRDILRKLLNLPQRLDSVSSSVASGVLHMPRPE